MRELPIIFSSPMVRAILENRKRQTRRLLKPQPQETYTEQFIGGQRHKTSYGWSWAKNPSDARMAVGSAAMLLQLPYQPGDRLWVRENWQAVHPTKDVETGLCDGLIVAESIPKDNDPDGIDATFAPWWTVVYAADPGWETQASDRGFPWRPSIHMPKWAARIWLTVTAVRVERLQDITPTDILAEGIKSDYARGREGMHPIEYFDATVASVFHDLWDSLHYPGAWDANPWVSVYEFVKEARHESD